MNPLNPKTPIVITTINAMTEAIRSFAGVENYYCLVVGDRKTPHESSFVHEDVRYISVDEQAAMSYNLVEHVPYNHYCRKNLGYLFAIASGTNEIAESDDDNIPYENWRDDISKLGTIQTDVLESPKAANIYKLFTKTHIWPRGLPLDAIEFSEEPQIVSSNDEKVMIVQGLADKSPDVDAIHRLVYPNVETTFDREREHIILGKGVYCPFNSQNTLWSREAFCYLYLPMYVRFRFTDILRGYVAQRGIAAMGGSLLFARSSVYQERNYHNILHDFADELDCYLRAGDIIELLEAVSLNGKPTEDIQIIYEALLKADVVEKREVEALAAWVKDYEALTCT